MEYQYAGKQDFSDLASGRVFYSLPGSPAFPVRLASEIFQRCLASREKIYHVSAPCTLYDPCCGAGYHLSVIAYLHAEHIRKAIGSDIEEKAIALAKQNLGLLSVAGIEKRITEISNMIEQYQKESHKDALASAYILKDRIIALALGHPIETNVFQASATDGKTIAKNIKPEWVDIVFTDVPYGKHSQWGNAHSAESVDPIGSMLSALTGILSPSSILAIVSDKQQRVAHESFQRVEQFQVGKRRVAILKPA